jgi:alpha-ketoglutarate-dependent taurine dioxygenase
MYATIDTFIDSSIRDLRGMPTERSPVESHQPAIRSHPVTGLKALNVTPRAVTGFAELSKKESGTLGLL